MKRHLLWIGAVAGMLAGCGPAAQARRLVAPNTEPGRTVLKLTGSAEYLIRQKLIDCHARIAMPDKTEIDVWVIKARGERADAPLGTMLLLHRLWESKASFPYFGAGQRLAAMGYDVVLPDLRAHGRSTGKFVTYGVTESHDVKAVMDKLIADKTVQGPLYVFGDALGGSAAIQLAAIDPRVKGLMAVAPYRDFRSIAARMVNPLGLMTQKNFEAIVSAAGQMAGFDPEQASALKAISQVRCPVLLVQPLLDLSVPKEHGEEIYKAAAEPKKLLLVTPGPEQVALVAVMENWLADKMDWLARTGLQVQQPPYVAPN